MPRRDALIHGAGDSPRWGPSPQNATVARPSVAAVASVGSPTVLVAVSATVVRGVVAAVASISSPSISVGSQQQGAVFGGNFGGNF